jgi:hypothetical protein
MHDPEHPPPPGSTILSRWTFSVAIWAMDNIQDGARQKLKRHPESSGNKSSEYVYKNFVHFPNGNRKCLVTLFSENVEILFQLTAIG